MKNEIFKKIEELRTIGDYSKTKSVTKEEVKVTIARTKEFLDITKELINEFKLIQNMKEDNSEKQI